MNELSPALEQILTDLRPAARQQALINRRTSRLRRIALIGAVTSGLAGSAAVAAVEIFSAPDSVKRDLIAVDQGMPVDLRLNPDVEHAHRVAVSADSSVYFASLPDGGYCAELVTGGKGRGAICATRTQTDQTPLGVTIPFTDPVTDTSPVTVSGHVSAAEARKVRLVYPDGGSDEVDISASGFYVADVPADHLRAVHEQGLLLMAIDGEGESRAEAVVPVDAISPPTEAQRPKDPIEIDTISDHGDFTALLGVRGHVYASGRPTTVELVFPDGHTTTAKITHGRFSVAVPEGRRHDFARTAGEIRAIDDAGQVVASRPVASVAYWRARDSG